MKNTFQIIGIVSIFLALLVPQLSFGQVKIGDTSNGGIVFKVNSNGSSGLICQTRDLGSMDWDDAVAACKKLGDGWRLPTKDELNLMYVNLYKKRKGGFTEDYYWSSTDEGSSESVWDQNFDGGEPNFGGKEGYNEYVRAVKKVSFKKSKSKTQATSKATSKAKDIYDYEGGLLVLNINKDISVRDDDYVCYTKNYTLSNNGKITATIEASASEGYYIIELITWGDDGFSGNGGTGSRMPIMPYCDDWNLREHTQAIYATGRSFQKALNDLEIKLNGDDGGLSVTGKGDPTKGSAVITIKRK